VLLIALHSKAQD